MLVLRFKIKINFIIIPEGRWFAVCAQNATYTIIKTYTLRKNPRHSPHMAYIIHKNTHTYTQNNKKTTQHRPAVHMMYKGSMWEKSQCSPEKYTQYNTFHCAALIIGLLWVLGVLCPKHTHQYWQYFGFMVGCHSQYLQSQSQTILNHVRSLVCKLIIQFIYIFSHMN